MSGLFVPAHLFNLLCDLFIVTIVFIQIYQFRTVGRQVLKFIVALNPE
jgi:hypothetical protein